MGHLVDAHLLLLTIHAELESTSSHIGHSLKGHRVWSIMRETVVLVRASATLLMTTTLLKVVNVVICVLFTRNHRVGEELRCEILRRALAVLHLVDDLMIVVASVPSLGASDGFHQHRVNSVALLHGLSLR